MPSVERSKRYRRNGGFWIIQRETETRLSLQIFVNCRRFYNYAENRVKLGIEAVFSGAKIMFVSIVRLLVALAFVASLLFIEPEVHSTSTGLFQLHSRCFKDGQTIPNEQIYTVAGGKNVSPELSWKKAPKGAKSFALTVFDPDARQGKGWWHWIQVDIPATASELWYGDGNSSHAVKFGYPFLKNSFGNLGYSGPCPPPRDSPHHYVFTLYALNVSSLSVKSDENPEAVSAEIGEHSIGTAVLTGRFGR